MPLLSLVVCVSKERDLLERLLKNAAGCYDDLVVVHDGEDVTDIRSLVVSAGGAFFERPRAFQQEPHWPFAWEKAKHDWILRLDADEFPGAELKQWLQEFQKSPAPGPDLSGYTCIWPLWNGKRATTKNWPAGRLFLFHRERVRYFGMAEQGPIPDDKLVPVSLVLRHEPRRKSYGVSNVIFRKQAYRWRWVIARSLMGKPTDLSCWRWDSGQWPVLWEDVRKKPLRTATSRMVLGPLRQAREMWQKEGYINISAIMGTGMHQFFLAVTFFFFRVRFRGKLPP